ncbi:SulP family inorganic anion transporter [Rhodococcus sp. As11]|uniref:SulP family inorganic anion transporter n=1 Tax=Rhodococcus sp. As11 TaxID=3029189 RepID=UPI003BA3CD59
MPPHGRRRRRTLGRCGSEMRALGVVNIAAGGTGGFPIRAGDSRTPMLEQAGARTQLAAIVSSPAVVVVRARRSHRTEPVELEDVAGYHDRPFAPATDPVSSAVCSSRLRGTSCCRHGRIRPHHRDPHPGGAVAGVGALNCGRSRVPVHAVGRERRRPLTHPRHRESAREPEWPSSSPDRRQACAVDRRRAR